MADNEVVSTEEDISVFKGVEDAKGKRSSPLSWVFSVNFAQGLQFAIVTQLFVIIFKTMGIPNGPAVFWASFLSFPWTFKPLWGPLIDKYGTKRGWTILMQLLIAICLTCMTFAFFLPASFVQWFPSELFGDVPPFFVICVIFLTIMAFASATHDIACDGYYMIALTEKQQAFYVGLRSTAFRIAMIVASGILIAVAFMVQAKTGPTPQEVIAAVVPVDNPSAEASTSGDDETVALVNDSPALQESDLVILSEFNYPSVDNASETLSIDLISDTEEKVSKFYINSPKVANEGQLVEADMASTTTLEVVKSDDESGQMVFRVRGKGIHGEGVVNRYNDNPTDQLQILIHDSSTETPAEDGVLIEGKPESKQTLIVNITKAPEEGYQTRVTIRVKPTGNIFRKLFMSSDSRGFKIDTEMLEFNTENWREGQTVTITMPEVVKERAEVVYEVAAGNVAWGWGATLFLCAIVYFLFVLLHWLVMPHPKGDKPAPNPNNTPFLVPVLALGVTVLIPLLYVGMLRSGFDFFKDSTRLFTIGEDPTTVATKGFDFIYSSVMWLFILGLAFFAIKYSYSIRHFVVKFIKSMSDISEVGFYDVFESFFSKKGIAITLGFLLTFRLGEAQLAQLKYPFLIGDIDSGALGMTLQEVAVTNTLYYLGLLTLGGIISGFMIARFGLRKMIWPCVFFMHAPNALYIYLAAAQPETLFPINTIVGIEAFGYGFGFAAYLMVMIIAAQGPYKTAHYALCTGFMALGYMIPGLWAGFLQEWIGYQTFFVMVVIFSLPGLLFIPFLPIDEEFGKKKE